MNFGNKWLLLAAFFIGVLVSYFALQFYLFDIDAKLNVIDVLLTIITLVVGIYIADTIQKSLNRGQNQYSFLENKLDDLWVTFINFSKNLTYSDNIDLESINFYTRDASPSIDFLKSILESFDVDTVCICDLESKINSLEEFLLSLPSQENIFELTEKKVEINNMILEINKCFKDLLKQIMDL